jgi:opacity protein-like surface antigen
MKHFLGLVLFAVVCSMSSIASANDWYAGVYGGANWDDVIDQKFVDNKTGSVVGGVVGRNIPAVTGLRAELDVAFRSNEVEIFGGKLSADHDTFTVMGNVVYDAPVFLGPFQPYALMGVGYGHTEATFENVSLLKLENSGLAWQFGVGLNARVAEGVTAGVGYRYLRTADIEVLGTELSDGSNNSIVAELKFAL